MMGFYNYGFLYSHTESSYVEKLLLTFLSNKYFGICALKKCKLLALLALI